LSKVWEDVTTATEVDVDIIKCTLTLSDQTKIIGINIPSGGVEKVVKVLVWVHQLQEAKRSNHLKRHF
jgi:hypothetical protein